VNAKAVCPKKLGDQDQDLAVIVNDQDFG